MRVLAILESICGRIGLLGVGKTTLSECARSLVWSRTSACHADDPGSNLGARTILRGLDREFGTSVLAVLVWSLDGWVERVGLFVVEREKGSEGW